MEDVVNPNFPGGTAHVAYIKGVELCGKSGSAQVISAQGLAKAKNRSDYKDNAWFVGFAPRRNPEIVVAVLVQSTMLHGGEIAAPVVRDVVKAYYDKKNGTLKPQLTAVAKNIDSRDRRCFSAGADAESASSAGRCPSRRPPVAREALRIRCSEYNESDSSRMREKAGIREYDWWLLAIAGAICSLGVVEIYSATHNIHGPGHCRVHQAGLLAGDRAYCAC